MTQTATRNDKTATLFLQRLTPQNSAALHSSFLDHGWDVLVVVRQGGSGGRSWGQQTIEPEVMYLPTNSIRRVVAVLRIMWRRRRGVVLVSGWRDSAAVTAHLCARALSIPRTVRFDSQLGLGGFQTKGGSDRLRRYLIKLVLGKRFTPIVISNRNKLFWHWILNEEAPFYYWPYSSPLPSTQEPPAFHNHEVCKFIFVGRLIEVKDLETLLAAFEAAQRKNPCRIQLTIVGEGRLEAALRSRQTPGVSFAGTCPHASLATVLDQHDVLVLPSKREAYGLVVEEAAQRRLKLVLSNAVGCVDDFLADRPEHCHNFEPGDVDHLQSLIEDLSRYCPGQKRPEPRRASFEIERSQLLRLIDELGRC